MDKNIKDIVVLVLLALAIFSLPTVINSSFADKKTNTYFERLDEDFNDCLKNAGENPRDIRFCREIKRSSELAFNSAKRVSDSQSNISITQTILYVFVFIVFLLIRKIENLEKKIDA